MGFNVTDDNKIWIGQNDKKYGPYSEENVRQWMKEGKLSREAVAWRHGMAGWVSLTSLFPVATTMIHPLLYHRRETRPRPAASRRLSIPVG